MFLSWSESAVISKCPPEPNLYRVVIICFGSMTAQRVGAVTIQPKNTRVVRCYVPHLGVHE